MKPILVSALVVMPSIVFCQGAEVTLLLANGHQLAGELLAVRESTLVLIVAGRTEMMKRQRGTDTVVVPGPDIQQVVIAGKSKILQSMGMGVVVGAGIGAFIGLASGDDPPGFLSFSAGEKAAMLGTLFGGAGLIVGLTVGIFKSSGEKSIEPLPGHDFSILKSVARYPRTEPEWLLRIN